MLLGLLDALPLIAEERARFGRRDTASLLANVDLLVAAAIFFNGRAVAEFGGLAAACAPVAWSSR